MSKASVGNFLVGMAGLSILRNWLAAPDVAAARFDELAGFLAHPDRPPLAMRLDVPSEDVQSGYARWARAYDAAANPPIPVEQPAGPAVLGPPPPRPPPRAVL